MKKFLSYIEGLGLLVLLFGGIPALFVVGYIFQISIVGIIGGFFHWLFSFIS